MGAATGDGDDQNHQMQVISDSSSTIEDTYEGQVTRHSHNNPLLVEDQMNKIELAVAEETNVDLTEQQALELSLSELDMVGGGSNGVFLL